MFKSFCLMVERILNKIVNKLEFLNQNSLTANQKLEGHDTRFIELEATLVTLSNRIHMVDEQLKGVDGKLGLYNLQMEVIGSRSHVIELRLDEMGDRIKENGNESVLLNQNVSELKSLLDVFGKRFGNLENGMFKIKERIDHLEQRIAKLEEKIDQLES